MRIDLVLVRLGAIFIIVYALQNLANYLLFILGGEGNTAIAIFEFCLVFAIPALISWVLWRFPSTVVGNLYSGDRGSSEGGDGTDRALLIGISLVGVYTLVFGIIDLAFFEAHRFAEFRLAGYADYFDFPILPQTFAGRVANLVQILLGLVLVFGRRGIASFLRQVRMPGAKPQ
ncbi:MAG: hypothetical protein QNI96_02985 [Woeseiaceae bacterium]|nr:hypothetical protein [Woeseiaceae bacterium]